MWVAELGCALGHGFEGFFASRDEFDAQRERGLVRCPQCDSPEVERRPSAPRLNFGAAQPQPAASGLRELVTRLRAGSEDLGRRFPEEARRIHAGQAPERAIRGQASSEEFEALLDEGIAVLPLPDVEDLASSH